MVSVSISELSSNLSSILRRVSEDGETVRIIDSDHAVAEIHPLPVEKRVTRHIGLAKGTFTVPPEFFLPLPDDLLDAFEGK